MVAPASESIDQRFAQLIRQFGLTKNSFAISLGKTASVVQHLIDGRNKPGYDLLCKVFEVYPNVSRDWLMLGKGPMLVSGEYAPRPPAPSKAPTAEPPLEPIYLSDIEIPVARRPGPGVAGSRLQPAEIAATLALAAAANQPARPVAPTPEEAPEPSPEPKAAAIPAPAAAPAAEVPRPPVAEPAVAVPPAPVAPVAALPPVATAPVAPVPAPVIPAPVAQPAPPAAPNPEAYVAAALHAQHLQHQLALAEMRNQHLLEQQQMLREMLAMARQAMV